FPQNLGYAGGYNEAIRRIESPWILLLNNDVVVHPEFVSRLASSMRRFQIDRLAVVGSVALQYSDRQTVDFGGGLLSFTGEGFPSHHGLPYHAGNLDPRPVGTACGAGMLVSRKIFLSLGGFDADYFAFCEETDYCWRAILAGYVVLETPSSLIYHKVGGTIGQLEFGNHFRLRLAERNRLSSLVKNFSGPFLLAALSISAVYDGFRILW